MNDFQLSISQDVLMATGVQIANQCAGIVSIHLHVVFTQEHVKMNVNQDGYRHFAFTVLFYIHIIKGRVKIFL